jgi:hypothetical protein
MDDDAGALARGVRIWPAGAFADQGLSDGESWRSCDQGPLICMD